MRIAKVYYRGELAGELIEHSSVSYDFVYEDNWFVNPHKPAISLTLPKSTKNHHADHLFPFFFNMLSEGYNKDLQCRLLKIDEEDYFGLLIAVAHNDTIGCVTVKPYSTKIR